MIDVEDQPDSISIDTSIFAHAIVAGSLFHNVANAYCDALIAAATPIYYSELVRVELPQALRKFANDPQGPSSSMRRHFRLQHWGRLEEVRLNWLQYGMS